MKAGKVIRSFSAKDGRRVVLRTPKWEDLDDLLELINSLVEEGAEIIRDEKVSREEEIDWLSKTLASLEKDEIFFLIAEVDGKVVASSDIHRLRGFERHVGILGIIIKNGFRDVGIGTEMMKTLVEQAYKMGLKVLTLSAFATNKRAIHVYEKVGFVKTGLIPKKHFKDGRYIDEIIMTKLLE
ncbi:MAG: GNAT family N-acetyltransferase [Candidatus Bathycorpusculaceae bacterium]